MESPSYTNSKRPPKLRSACNECHAAKVRCSGEKTGCQRCSNLRLKCAFSISRIGKVPGKRSKANRATVTASTSSSASISISSSSLSTPIMSTPLPMTSHSYDSPRAYEARNAIPIPASYPFTQEYAAGLSLANETSYAQSSPSYLTQSRREDSSSLNNLCWAPELDQLGGQGLLSPDWEIDAEETFLQVPPQPPASVPTYVDVTSDGRNASEAYASPTESIPPSQYPLYLHLLQSVDHSMRLANQCRSPGQHTSTQDMILDATQRYLTTLLQSTESLSFTHTYNEEHLLFSVALDKIIYLLKVGYTDLRRQMEVYESMCIGVAEPAKGWVRYGAFEMDVFEQVSYCRKLFVEEVKRAGLCLDRLMEAMGYLAMPGSGSWSPGRHERLCEEMKRRLDGLLDSLEGDQGAQGVHLVG